MASITLHRRLSAALWRRPSLALTATLVPPLAWFVLIYLGALVLLFITAFWSVDALTGEIDRTWTFENFSRILGSPTYRAIALRTIGMAAAVTITDALIAYPFAFFMARIAGPKLRVTLLTLVLLPLWSSYLARVYAWRLILAHDGVLNWALNSIGLPDLDIGYSRWAMWIVFSYIWLPFMITPLYTALERIPHSLFEASEDLGARSWRTFGRVVLPLSLPGLVAGSIFTFSLTLGDYITPVLVGGPGSDFIGNVVYANVGIANNVPFAAAYAAIPLIVMALYLTLARRLGASDAM
ncbi:ABC transporter permease [Lichenifustis flavocetrariae]|uniref:ABC transporter permease n=1 Tax=Lichenifustis flavocetrariae TaxID=2949735 RepID=A0AA42CLP5_9HYPH|nr:ABC transporter permease [Lichenifustis flavocetrariae]MCW6507592.1 ABC transporter permease [Lichenifustis flavocetrariae]